MGLGPSIFQVCSRQSWAKTLVLQDSSCHFHPATGPVQVPLWARSGGLTFPQTPDTPVIMVGPGTGVAPFRAAVQERVAQGRTGERARSRVGPGPASRRLAGESRSQSTPCLPRELSVLRLPPARPGLLLGSRVEGAGGEGLPASRHSLLSRSGGCAPKTKTGSGAGRRLTPPPPRRSGRCTCSTSSGSSGRWCGSYWTTGAPPSTWQGEPGLWGGAEACPPGVPATLSLLPHVCPAMPSTCRQMCQRP